MTGVHRTVNGAAKRFVTVTAGGAFSRARWLFVSAMGCRSRSCRRELSGASEPALVLGLLLAGCARDAPFEIPPTDQERVTRMVGEPCALSSAPQASSTPPRIFVELATFEGDLASIQEANAPVAQGVAAPRTFSQMLADPRWRAITVRHMIASDGVRQTFPWESGRPRVSRKCPASERWDLSMTPHVAGHSP